MPLGKPGSCQHLLVYLWRGKGRRAALLWGDVVPPPENPGEGTESRPSCAGRGRTALPGALQCWGGGGRFLPRPHVRAEPIAWSLPRGGRSHGAFAARLVAEGTAVLPACGLLDPKSRVEQTQLSRCGAELSPGALCYS